MKKALFTLMALAVIVTVQAQQTDTLANDPNKVFVAVEMEPGFRGGMQNFYNYLSQNLRYPPDAYKNRVQGRVFLTFIVEKDGSLTDVKVVRGLSEDIDAEAVMVLQNSPKWTPGVQNGRPVRVQYTVPINFKLPPLQQVTSVPDSDKIFTAIEHDPSFPGGIEGLYKYLQKNLRYPADARQNNIQGKVFLSFVVEKDGSLSGIRVVRGISDDLNAEAIRVMSNCPKWNPGTQNGHTVRVMYTMPVSFQLD